MPGRSVPHQLVDEPLAGLEEAPCEAHGVSVQQVALSWLLAHSDMVVPIPGTTNIRHLDDNVDAAKSLSMLLSLQGHAVRVAHEGLTALRAAEDFQPHVVLLDIGLPRMDGYEVARRLRERPETETMLLVALTGYGQDSDKQRALSAGFDEHLTKPVKIERLQALLNRPR